MAVNRFIPTPVGNMIRDPLFSYRWAVHPHACGEHVLPSRATSVSAVHPHACGEHAVTADTPYEVDGSSPRLWGTWPPVDGNAVTVGSSPRLWGTLSQLYW